MTLTTDNDADNHLLAHLRKLGDRQWKYENSVINLIASDNAYPRDQAGDPCYRGHMIQEGLKGSRPFPGAAIHDEIEAFAEEIACQVFGAEHANLQPHSCSQANQAVYHALLSPGERVLALGFRQGGHLTHGLASNFSGRFYQFTSFGTGPDGFIDYTAARDLALSVKPRLVVCGSSSYPRIFEAERLRTIADEVGALLMFDLSHEAGLIAGGVFPNPVPFSDVSTMSLDKTLRGPFGGVVLTRGYLAARIDRAIHPGTQSSFPIRKLVDAAHALILTRTAGFQNYARRVLANIKAMEQTFLASGTPMLTGGTDKHYIVLDVGKGFVLTGADAERRLEAIGILASRQTLPNDGSSRSAEAKGLRIGTPWATSRGYSTDELREVASIILIALSPDIDLERLMDLQGKVKALSKRKRLGDVWDDLS